MTLQEAFDKVQKLGLTTSQYCKVIEIIGEYGNSVRTKTTKDTIRILKEQ